MSPSKRSMKRSTTRNPPITPGSRPARMAQHGFSAEPLYAVWRTMLARCYNPGHTGYHRYGGRGITVDEVWFDYPPFRSWANRVGYRKGMQIDRIDNDGSYGPDNCRWTTSQGNNRNRSNNKVIEYDGLAQPLANWADDRRCVVPYQMLWERLQHGWAFEDALTTPVRRTGGYRLIEAFGEVKSVTEWVLDDRCSLTVKTLWARINRGWEPERAVSSPPRMSRR